MEYDETVRQADQLDRVVENIIRGDCDLFEGVEARQLPRDTMAVVDLAMFVMPTDAAEGKESEQRLCLVAAREVERLTPEHGSGPRIASSAWSRFMNPVLEAGLAVTAFCVALFLEPMPTVGEGRSIDTLSRPWYNITMGKYPVGSADNDVGRLSYLCCSDVGSGYGAAACR